MSPSNSSDEESEDPSEEEQFKPFKGAKLARKDAESSTGDENDSDDSSSFIVEDDNQAVAAELPSEFSMRSHDDLSHQFKIIFQLFVHVAVRTSAERHTFMSEQVKGKLHHTGCQIKNSQSDRYSPGLLCLSFKNDPQKAIGSTRLTGGFLHMETKVQEGTR